MHEMSLCEGVLQVIESHAIAQEFERVEAVWLEVGALAGVEVEALKFCFDAVMRGSVAEGAVLNIVDLPGAAWCMICGETVAVKQRFDECPKCGSYQLQVTGGEEFKVKELEVT